MNLNYKGMRRFSTPDRHSNHPHPSTRRTVSSKRGQLQHHPPTNTIPTEQSVLGSNESFFSPASPHLRQENFGIVITSTHPRPTSTSPTPLRHQHTSPYFGGPSPSAVTATPPLHHHQDRNQRFRSYLNSLMQEEDFPISEFRAF